jgi:branched-chain amino acid transport system substrate-binding protein
VRSANELKLNVKMFGGGMVGLQATALKMQLGPLLNGIVNFDLWLPAGPLASPQALELLRKYQARAGAEGADPLGYYSVPSAYAQIELLGQAVAATGSLDQGKLAEYLHTATHKTMVGSFKFGPDGEWAQSRLIFLQFHGITGNTIDQFREMNTQAVIAPEELKSGTLIYPFTDARK